MLSTWSIASFFMTATKCKRFMRQSQAPLLMGSCSITVKEMPSAQYTNSL